MRIALIVVPLVILLAVGGFVAFKIIGLKERLVAQLEAALHATAQIGSLSLDLRQGELLATNISLQNVRPDSPWDNAAIDQAAVHFRFADLFAPTLPLQVEITGWKASLHSPGAVTAGGASTPGGNTIAPGFNATPTDQSGPSWARVNHIAASNGEVTIHLANDQTIAAHGVSFHADTPGGPDWTTDLQASSIVAGTLTTGTSSVEIHSTRDDATFTNLTVHCGDGQVSGGGDLDLAAPHTLKGSFTATAVPVTMLVTTRWQMKVSGLVSGTADYQGDDDSATASGKLSVSGGKFNLFPWLGKATMLVGLPDITNMQIDQATSDFAWKNHILTLQNIDVLKPDVFRINGQADIAADDTIDAHLKLGLPGAAVAKWPKLQTDVFNAPNGDYDFTDVHVTGTPDQLQEDLSSRLLTVGLEQGGDLLQQTKTKATDLINSFLK
jgi:hypothetical protein